MPEEIAVVHSRTTAEPAHGVAHLGIDKRVHDHGRVSSRGCDSPLEVGNAVAAWMANFFEFLFRKLRLERLNKACSCLAC